MLRAQATIIVGMDIFVGTIFAFFLVTDTARRHYQHHAVTITYQCRMILSGHVNLRLEEGVSDVHTRALGVIIANWKPRPVYQLELL